PLNDFDAVAVRVSDEEPVRARDRGRLLHGNAARIAKVAGGRAIGDTQREMPRAGRVGPVLQQQVQLRVAELEPEDLEIECPRLGDLAQAQQVAVETPAAL